MNPYLKQYKKSQIETATPEQIFIMLFDALVNYTLKGKKAMVEKNIQDTHNNIVAAQNILIEFMSTLDMELGGQLAQNLFSLYSYLHQRLVEANIKKDLKAMDEVIEHLQGLRTTWREAVDIANKEKGSIQDNEIEKDGQASYEFDG